MGQRKYILPILTFCILFSSRAYAEHITPADQVCDASGSGRGSALAFGGKPISLLSGVEFFSRTDLALGSLFPISVTREYDSSSNYDSPLGYGWGLNYDKRLYTYPDGSVTVRRDCGGKTRFAWSATGYSSTAAYGGTLVQNADGTYTYTDKYGAKDNYDAQGRIVSSIASNGTSLVFTYTGAVREALWGLLLANINQSSSLTVAYDYRLGKIEEKDASGNLTGVWVVLNYDAVTGRLIDIQDSTGRLVTYAHDSIGNLTGVTGPGGSAIYDYNDPYNKHHVTTIDEGQGAYINTYNSEGKVTRQAHGNGTIDFAYVTPYQETTMTKTIKDASGNVLNTQVRTTEFDDNGVLVKVTDTFGNVIVYQRDSSSWITREEYWENTGTVASPTLVLRTAMNFTYDDKGTMLTKTEAQGTAIEKTTAWTYDPVFSKVLTETVKSVVDPAQNKVTTNTYDSNGNMLTTTETGLLGDGTPYTYTTTYTYDANGHVLAIDGPRTDVQDVTAYSYDPVTNYLTAVTRPLAGSTTYANFDALGNPQTVTDPNGNATAYTYDAIGRVLTVKAPGDTNPTQYAYVSGGSCPSCGASKIDHVTLPEGNTIWYTYNAMGNLSAIKDDAGNSINYTYDSEGNKLTEQINDSSGTLQKSLSYGYDALNRLSKIVNPDNTYTQYGYNALGSRTSAKDPNGNATTYGYDALNRLASVVQPGTVTTAYAYDTNNNLTSVTDANGHVTTYRYDDHRRLYQVTSPDTGTTTYQYDPGGNMISKTDAKGVTITYQYDAANRLTNINFPSDPAIVYAYDNCPNGKGRLCSMTDASGTTVYEWTAKGEIKKETKTIDSIQYVTQYTYDQNGNLKTMTYPSGRVVTYNYSNNLVTSVLNNAANLATNITYKPYGGMSSITYGNGLAGSISYDNQYRVTGITAGSVMNLNYPTYDANGNITGITNNLDATKNKSFGYDALDRLASGTGPWGSLAWTYDGVGNRQAENSTVYSYTPGTNKLSGIGGSSYSFDSDGNTTSDGTRGYTYNQNQRLIQAVNGATTANYTYNGNGQRVKKVVNGTTTVFHYDQRGQLIAETDDAGTVNAEYVYFNGRPLAMIAGTSVYFYHDDNLGTPQEMTDATGAVVWSADYKSFGGVNITTNTITNNLRFTGQYYDSETGLHYNYMRDYNPVIGRYIEADRIGLRGGINLYVYGRNNAARFTDPTGQAVFGPGYIQNPQTYFINPPPSDPWPGPQPGSKCYKCDMAGLAKCLGQLPGPNTLNDCVACAFALANVEDPYGWLKIPSCVKCGGNLALTKGPCFTNNCSAGTLDCKGNCK